MGMAVCQIVNITLKFLALWGGNNAKTHLGGIIIAPDPFTIHLKVETADMRFSFRHDFHLIPGIALYVRHPGTFYTTSGNTDIL